jgi:hypothetical protein
MAAPISGKLRHGAATLNSEPATRAQGTVGTELAAALLPYLENLAKQCPGLLEVWLFGSRANETAHNGSDWDLMIYGRPGIFDSLSAKRTLECENVDLFVVQGSGGCQALCSKPSPARKHPKKLSLSEMEWRRSSSTSAHYVGEAPYLDRNGNEVPNRYDLVDQLAYKIWHNRPSRPQAYLLDTNIFNALIKKEIPLRALFNGQYFMTSWQEVEIRKTTNPDMREMLLSQLQSLQNPIPVSESTLYTTTWDAKWDSPWSPGGCFFHEILTELKRRQSSARKNKSHQVDASIIEVCIFEGLTFVSNDSVARQVAGLFDVPTLSLHEDKSA